MVSPINSAFSSLPYLLADLTEHALFPVPIVYPVYLRYQFSAFRHIIQFVVNVEQTSEQFALLVDIRQLVRVFLTYPDASFSFEAVAAIPTVLPGKIRYSSPCIISLPACS